MNRYRSLLIISCMLAVSILSISTTASIPSTCYVGVSWKENYAWPWEDCYLAQEDADGFLNKITSDSHWYKKFRITEYNNHRGQWEYTNDQNYVEKAHFAYYAGHGYYNPSTGKAWMVFYVNPIHDSPRINPDYCDWGDEGPLKWVALACCDVGYKTYKALDGLHLICAAKCEIDEATYGIKFGNYLVNYDKSIKSAWFDTMDYYKTKVHGVVNVVGEDSSVGNDHIYWHGYVAPDPPIDNYYYEWTHDPNAGWYGQGGGHK